MIYELVSLGDYICDEWHSCYSPNVGLSSGLGCFATLGHRSESWFKVLSLDAPTLRCGYESWLKSELTPSPKS